MITKQQAIADLQDYSTDHDLVIRDEVIKMSIESLKYTIPFNEYEELIQTITNKQTVDGFDFEIASKQIDDWCIKTMRGILCSYYADKLQRDVDKLQRGN